MDMKVIQRFQDCWKGYLTAPDTLRWMDNIKEVEPDVNDMMGVRIDTTTSMLRVVRAFVKMADPEVIDQVQKRPEDLEHYNHHLQNLHGGLESAMSTYICEMMLQCKFNADKVVDKMTDLFLRAPYQKVMSKERAVNLLGDAAAMHLLGKADHLADFFVACRAIQDSFETCEIFDWLAGVENPSKYDWTTEGQARIQKENEERMAAMASSNLGQLMFQAIGGMSLQERLEATGESDPASKTLLH